MTTPECIADAAARFRVEGSRGIGWTFYQCMTTEDHTAFDNFLVAQKHPSAYEPGTTYHRFCLYVSNL